jgi:hypothetical protein
MTEDRKNDLTFCQKVGITLSRNAEDFSRALSKMDSQYGAYKLNDDRGRLCGPRWDKFQGRGNPTHE